MSYVTGTLSDFESRMHQGAVDSSTLSSYISEGNNYLASGTGVVWPQLSGKWELEARKRSAQFTADLTQLNVQQFGTGPGAPQSFAIASGSTGGGVGLSWTTGASPAATGYEIWRSLDGGALSLYVTQTGLNYTDASGSNPAAGHYQTYETRGIWTGSPGSFSSTRSIGNTLPNSNTVASVSYSDMQVMLGNFNSSSNSNLTSVIAPVLVRVAGQINLSSNTALSTVSMPSLAAVGAQLFLGDSTALATLNLSSLVTVGGDFQAQNKNVLKNFSLPLLQSVASHCTFYGCPQVTGINLNSLKNIGGGGRLDFNSDTSLSFVSLPAFTGVDSDLNVSACSALTGLSVPVLKNIGGALNLDSSNLLSSVTLPALTSIGGFSAQTCTGLQYLSATGALTVALDCHITNNHAMTGLNLPNATYTDGIFFNAAGCALTSATVNQILSRFVASAVTTCVIDLSGGTNGAPTGQGATDKAALISSGNTVTTN
jgi:hypothetical protein